MRKGSRKKMTVFFLVARPLRLSSNLVAIDTFFSFLVLKQKKTDFVNKKNFPNYPHLVAGPLK